MDEQKHYGRMLLIIAAALLIQALTTSALVIMDNWSLVHSACCGR